MTADASQASLRTFSMTSSAENPPTSPSSLARDSVGTTLTNSALFLIGIITWIAVARFLGPVWRGALALVMLAPSIVMKTGSFGFDQGMVVVGGKEPRTLGPLARTGIVLAFLMSLISIGLLAAFMWGFPTTFWRLTQQTWLRDQFMLISLAFPLHLMTMVYDAAIYAEDRIAARNAKELWVNVVMLVAILAAVFIWNLRLMAVIGAYLLANVVSLAYGWLLVRRRVHLDGGIDAGLAGRAVKLGFPVYLAQLASYAMLPVMMVLLSFALPGNRNENLERIAFFTMAYQMVDRILPVTRSISFALLPKITGAGEIEAGEMAAKASRHTLLVSIVIFALLFVFMHPIVAILLGKRYLSVVGAFAIMAPGGVALSLIGVWSAHLLARMRPLDVARAGIIGVVVALICAGVGFRFLPEGREVLAASLAVVVGTFVNAAFLLPPFCSAAKIGPDKALIPTVADLRDWRRVPGYVREIIRRKRAPVG